MKHIKTYKLFEDLRVPIGNHDINDLKDICLELEDEWFDIKFDHMEWNGNHAEIRIKKSGGAYSSNPYAAKEATFNYNQVSEVVHRLEDYLGDFLYKVDILYIKKGFGLTWKSNSIEDFTNKNIQAVSIEYKD